MMYGNNEISQSLQQIVSIIRAGGVLIADTPDGPFGLTYTRFNLSVGRYYSACDAPAYAFYCNNRRHVYKSPLHAAQAFQGGVGYKKVQQAIAKYHEDN